MFGLSDNAKYNDIPLYIPDEVKEAILDDFHENCENYLLKSLVWDYLHEDRIRHILQDPIEDLKNHNPRVGYIRYMLKSINVEEIVIQGTFAKVELIGEAIIETSQRKTINELQITVRVFNLP
jgi:hypothetical protein